MNKPRFLRVKLFYSVVSFCFKVTTGYNREVRLVVGKSVATDAASQLHVLWHDRHALSVDATQIGVLEESDEIIFRSFLGLESKKLLVNSS